MDLKVFLSYVSTHFHVVFGTTLALFFATSGLLLIRSIGEKQKGHAEGGGGGGHPVDIDLDAIEGVVKRALQGQTIQIAASSAPAVEGSAPMAGNPEVDASALLEKTTEIETLKREIDRLKLMAPTAAEVQAGAGGGADAELKKKVDELQARLAEYEIIEDDIADLSAFKEENAKLKEEVEKLKAEVATAATAAPVAAAPAAAAAAPAAPEIKFEKTERFELDPNDLIVQEFAAAVKDQDGLKAANAAPASEDPQAAIDAMLAGGGAPAEEAPAVAEDPQAAIDAMLAGGATETAAPVAEDPQAAIDAMLAGTAEAPSAPIEDPQAAIDAMLAGTSETPAPETKEEDPQAAIDAMLAQSTQAEAQPDDAQAAIEAMLADAASSSEADPLSEITDADKLLSEVTSLETIGSDASGDVLEEALDADKLLAEVDDLEKNQKAG